MCTMFLQFEHEDCEESRGFNNTDAEVPATMTVDDDDNGVGVHFM